MKGFKVVQCIKISIKVSIYALFKAAVCPKDQKKLRLIMKKMYIGVSDQVVLKLKHAQLQTKPNKSFELHSGYMCLS